MLGLLAEGAMYRSKFLISILFALSGCAASTSSLQSASSSEIGCGPDEIVVANYKLNMYTSSWTAQCNGKTYYCSGSDTLKDRVSCKEAQAK
jgi:hypothetical protein